MIAFYIFTYFSPKSTYPLAGVECSRSKAEAESEWNDQEKFVHICGKRFHDRSTSKINITIFTGKSLLKNDLLIYLNNELIHTFNKIDHTYFVLELSLNNGINVIKAVVADPSSSDQLASDSVEFEKVDQPNPDYVFLNKTEIDNKSIMWSSSWCIYCYLSYVFG